MSWGVMAIPLTWSAISPNPRIPSIIHQRCCHVIPLASSCPSILNPILLKSPRTNMRCNSTGDSGGNVSKTVLDAFFLGKALGEVLNERIESNMGELLSILGRFQAEQQKQVLEFQEDVLEKARRAKEQASREGMEARGGLVSKVDRVSETTSSASDSVTSYTEEDPLIRLLND